MNPLLEEFDDNFFELCYAFESWELELELMKQFSQFKSNLE